MNFAHAGRRWLLVAGMIVWLSCGVAFAPADEPASPPRIDPAAWYEVDAGWPQAAPGLEWDAVPGVAVDADDRVWVFTRARPPVRAYTSEGRLDRAWGEKEVHSAHHLKIDSRGRIWLADIGRHVVMQFTPEGQLLKTLGTPDEAGEDERRLNKPTDMAITPEGDVFVSDGYGNNRIVHFDADGRFVKAWGRAGQRPGEFNTPHAIALDSEGRLYVADRSNARVQVFDQSGKFLDQWTDIVTPWGFCVTPQDEIWVCGSSPTSWKLSGPDAFGCPPRDQVFMKFAPSGKLVQLWTVPKGTDGQEQPGELNWVHCLALDSRGNIYTGDIMGKRVQKFVPRGSR
ncbi:MAG TPA: peptidyl-alpha-hydroxyglycine alpha-amidating lyase family protein [Planctomycetaceae bacterium]|nr:peptidyl-alpha-hydroxyglycine alpha-amidating lyase family protein [Planctomycetaceae bacterium]